jgi:hypothetical protein
MYSTVLLLLVTYIICFSEIIQLTNAFSPIIPRIFSTRLSFTITPNLTPITKNCNSLKLSENAFPELDMGEFKLANLRQIEGDDNFGKFRLEATIKSDELNGKILLCWSIVISPATLLIMKSQRCYFNDSIRIVC